MNVAILFDGTEAMEVRADMLLAGKKLYSYSLKAFYLHPVIDYIVILWSGCKVGLQIEKDIERWKAEYGVDKPVRVESGTVDLRHIRFPFSGDLNGIEKWKIDLYVLHDMRYPFVTMDMICRVTQKAAIYGAAVLSEAVEDVMLVCSGQDVLEGGNLRYVKFPAAFRAEDEMLDILEDVAGALVKCAGVRAYLCDAMEWNPFVCTLEALEMAESISRQIG